MSGNTSASGGFLLPVLTGPAPLQGDALADYIQGWIVGLTGISGTLVRPSWQEFVPSLPFEPGATCWCAFGITTRNGPESPVIQHDPAGGGGLGQDVFWRNQELSILLTWYDLSVTGQADHYDGIMHDGMTIGQNREYLKAQGFDYASCSDATAVPVIIKERWQYRLDRRVILRRVINRAYPVQTLTGATVAFQANQAPAESVQIS